ncbi:nuclear transport factor 2 family protein [Zavarzinia sp. CC-PAN008]|uniref:nuclear transport factor 2 family protein n=1 Tax=Zavarzinia sp. CC-PAN008 TaxID=3243332 RepID=UPI003F749AAC
MTEEQKAALLAPMAKLGEAFGGKPISAERKQAIWQEVLHENAVWEAPFCESRVYIEGRDAVGHFFDWLLEMVPSFTSTTTALHWTEDPELIVVEVSGGGPVKHGGVYDQRYCTLIRVRDGKLLHMKEHFNPIETYRAFGKEHFHAAVDAICAGRKAAA